MKKKPFIIPFDGLILILAILFTTLGLVQGLMLSTKIPFYTCSVVLLCLWGIATILKKIRMKWWNLFIFGIYILFLLYLYGSYRGSDAPYALLTTIASVLFMMASLNYEISDAEMKLFAWIAIFGAVMMSIAFFLGANRTATSFGVTIGEWNPQGIGDWAFILGATVYISVQYFNPRKFFRVLGYGLVSLMILVAIQSDNVTAELAYLLFCAAFFYKNYTGKLARWGSYFVPLVPMLVGKISIYIFQNKLFFFADGFSLLHGRESRWIHYLDIAKNVSITQRYTKFYEIYTHNIFWEHVLFYGYFVAVGYVFLMVLSLTSASKNIKCKYQFMSYVAFVCLLLISSTESAIFSTGQGGTFIYAFVLLLIMKKKEK